VAVSAPFDLSPANPDWDAWQGDVGRNDLRIPFARWLPKEYGTGVAGDLLVHLISGMMFMLGINQPPRYRLPSAEFVTGKMGALPDVHGSVYYFGDFVYTPESRVQAQEIYRIGVREVCRR
jgi:hypothetical protein